MNPCQLSIDTNTQWESAYLSLGSTDTDVQTFIIWKKAKSLDNTWLIVPNNSKLCDEETLLPKPKLINILSKQQSNAIIFTLPNKEDCNQTWIRIYELILNFLEDGVEARIILGCDSSIIKNHNLKPGIIYNLKKTLTDSSLTENSKNTISTCSNAFTAFAGTCHTYTKQT